MSDTKEVQAATPEKIEGETATLETRAKAMVVTNQDEAVRVADFLKDVKALKAQVDETFDPIITAAHKAHKEALAAKKRHMDPLEAIDRLLRGKVLTWETEERRKENERRQAEEVKARKEAEDRKLAEAETLAEFGLHDAADEVLSEDVVVERAEPARYPAVAGMSFRYSYSVEVEDLGALVRAVYEGKENASLIQANLPALNALARSVKDEFKVPGVRLIKTRTTVV